MTEQGSGLVVPHNEPAFSRCALLLGASDCLRFPSPAIILQEDSVFTKPAVRKTVAMQSPSKSYTQCCFVYVYWIYAV